MRAIETAQPVADALGCLSTSTTGSPSTTATWPHYIPIEQLRPSDPAGLQRLIDGQLPGGVDEDAFLARIGAAVADSSPRPTTTTPSRCSVTVG